MLKFLPCLLSFSRSASATGSEQNLHNQFHHWVPRRKSKKKDWLIRKCSAVWSQRNIFMEKRSKFSYTAHKHMGTRERWKGCRVINLSSEISTPLWSAGCIVCIRCFQNGILIRNQFVSVSQSDVRTVMWPEL